MRIKYQIKKWKQLPIWHANMFHRKKSKVFFQTSYRSKSLCQRTCNRQNWLFKKQCMLYFIFSSYFLEPNGLPGIPENQQTIYLKKKHMNRNIYIGKTNHNIQIFSESKFLKRRHPKNTKFIFPRRNFQQKASKQTATQINYKKNQQQKHVPKKRFLNKLLHTPKKKTIPTQVPNNSKFPKKALLLNKLLHTPEKIKTHVPITSSQ